MKYLLLISLISVSLVSPIYAQIIEHDLRRLDQKNQIKRNNWPTRLGNKEDRKCKKCEQREAQARSEYLRRVLDSSRSIPYQNSVQSLIFADEKFLQKCWRRLKTKELEIFFTIGEDGVARDFVSFPQAVSTGCLKKRIVKLEYPKPEGDYFAWMVASDSQGS